MPTLPPLTEELSHLPTDQIHARVGEGWCFDIMRSASSGCAGESIYEWK